MSLLVSFLDAQLLIGGVPILWREIIGNLFGLAAAIGGMRRVVWAWPVGIVGNLTLLTVFLGGVYMGVKNRYTDHGIETEALALPEKLYERIEFAAENLAKIV